MVDLQMKNTDQKLFESDLTQENYDVVCQRFFSVLSLAMQETGTSNTRSAIEA
jgi:hypothetical protein